MSTTYNHIFSGVMTTLAIVSALPEDIIAIVPAKYKPYAVAAPMIAMWLKGQLNLQAPPPGKK